MRTPNIGDIVSGKNIALQPVKIVVKSLNFQGETDVLRSVSGPVLKNGRPGKLVAHLFPEHGWEVEGRFKKLSERLRDLEEGLQLWVPEEEYAESTIRTLASRTGAQMDVRFEVVAAGGGCFITNLGPRSLPLASARRGGARPKAGPRVSVTLALPVPVHERLSAERERSGRSFVKIVADLIEAMPDLRAEDEF